MAPLAPALALCLAVLAPLAPGTRAGDCKGQRQVLREAPGFVTDGAGNYSVNGNCEWLIEGEWGGVGRTPTPRAAACVRAPIRAARPAPRTLQLQCGRAFHPPARFHPLFRARPSSPVGKWHPVPEGQLASSDTSEGCCESLLEALGSEPDHLAWNLPSACL